MSRYRYVPLALLAAAFLWAATLSVAQERRADERGKGADTRAKTFTGRIIRVDADKGALVLGVGTDVDRDRGGRPGSGTPGTGTPERGTLERAQKERPGSASEKAENDRGTSMMTVKFGKDVRVSLDGKDATPKDIRVGLFGRVTVRVDRGKSGDRLSTGGDRGKAGDPPPDKNPGGDKTAGGAEGRVVMAERIEVFTRPPAQRGGDRGKEKRSGDRPSDR